MFGHCSQVSCHKFSQPGKSEGSLNSQEAFCINFETLCERFVSRCCRNVHIGCELPRPYALLVGDEKSGDVWWGMSQDGQDVNWIDDVWCLPYCSIGCPASWCLTSDSNRNVSKFLCSSSIYQRQYTKAIPSLQLAVCWQGRANNCVTLSESWRLASFSFTMQKPGFSMLFRCFIWINVIGFFMLSRTGKYCRQQQLFEFGPGHTCTPLL